MTKILTHFIDGRLTPPQDRRRGEVYDPNTGEIQAHVEFADRDVVDQAVAAARKAQGEWGKINPQRRARVMFAFKQLVEARMDELALLLSREHGKIPADSRGDIIRGLDVVEFACGVPHLTKGEYSQDVGPGVDMFSMRKPVGVAVGITPFNFPAMIPMWMFAPAIACGNGFICKPSEKDPSLPLKLAELMIEAGAPAGLLNVVNGDRETVESLIGHPDIDAVSFVGSTAIAQSVYRTAASSGKRVQAMGGAKNHMIVMPDADIDNVVDNLIGSGYGSGGERCMAISAAVPVGEKTADRLIERLVPRVQSLRIGLSTAEDADYGPLVTAAHKKRVTDYIAMGEREGARLLVDGRGFALQGYEGGFFLGGSLFDGVTPDMQSYRDEIFGPVLQILRVDDYEQALALPSKHAYGNGAAIFTRDGDVARDFVDRVEVGMVGVNVPIPVPLAYHSFGGWKRSAFGDMNQHGVDGIRFYTRLKTTTARWPRGLREDPSFSIPVMR